MSDFRESLDELRSILDEGRHRQKDTKWQHKLIRSFEVTHELALMTINEYFRKMGRSNFTGSRDLTVEAFHEELIDDGKGWLDMIIDRIKFNPIYPEDFQQQLSAQIEKRYILMMENFERKMMARLELS